MKNTCSKAGILLKVQMFSLVGSRKDLNDAEGVRGKLMRKVLEPGKGANIKIGRGQSTQS